VGANELLKQNWQSNLTYKISSFCAEEREYARRERVCGLDRPAEAAGELALRRSRCRTAVMVRCCCRSSTDRAVGEAERFGIVDFVQDPPADRVAELRAFFENSVALVDPNLLQRNVEMMRRFDESRAQAERELADLQRNLLERQRECRSQRIRRRPMR